MTYRTPPLSFLCVLCLIVSVSGQGPSSNKEPSTKPPGTKAAKPAKALLAVATGMIQGDRVRAWEIIDDFQRSIELAKGFTSEAPRSLATLAIARAALEKKATDRP